MEIDDFIKEHTRASISVSRPNFGPNPPKTFDSGKMLKFAITSILMAIASVLFYFVGTLTVDATGSIVPLIILGPISSIFGVFSLAYVIATGVYIGVNS